MKYFLTILTIILGLNLKAQTDTTQYLDSLTASKLLDEVIGGTEGHNIINDDTKLIDTKEKAIKLAEFYLFYGYGKQNIQKQKPYNIHFIKMRWIISGTLAKGYKGGTFLIIIDSTNGSVLRITHGK